MQKIMCSKCKVPLEPKKARFKYLGRELHADVPRCPICGQIYLSEEFVKNRVQKIESSVEEK